MGRNTNELLTSFEDLRTTCDHDVDSQGDLTEVRLQKEASAEVEGNPIDDWFPVLGTTRNWRPASFPLALRLNQNGTQSQKMTVSN